MQISDPDSRQPTTDSDFYLVGVGASAGGLEALEQMFQVMPANSGMSFVIVQHLSPDFRSLMDELLARRTEMPIYRVEDGMQVQPNSLYLIPPKQEMIVSGGRLLLTEKDSSQSLTLPIDHFFRSLAQDAGRQSIAVVLSGSGSDGSRGVREIHEVGGLVVAQSPESAKFDSMPNSAIDSGVVHAIVEPAQISEVLAKYAQHGVHTLLQPDNEHPADESSLERIFRLLQQRHKIDFHHYKPATIGRRIERRIQLNHHGDIDEYVSVLETDAAEVDQLFKDLLIGVTCFFRDPNAFQELRRDILPGLVEALAADEEFRVWVAGCCTGEEAYSLAILIDECLHEMNRSLAVKIFATDMHRTSLDIAHAGIYPASALQELSAARRDTYFQATETGYEVAPRIRKMIVFAPHNIVKDAPFTRLSLISCRNLLIYLRPAAQKKVLSLFHFGLKTGGALLLGASESPGELSDEFETQNERWRIFRKRRDIRLPTDIRSVMLLESSAYRPALPAPTQRRTLANDRDLVSTYDALMDRFMPPAVLVNEQREVLHVFGGAGEFLSLRDGRLSANLLELIDGDLKLALTGGLQRVAKSGSPVSYSRVRVGSPPAEKLVRLEISPLSAGGAGARYLVCFEELDAPPNWPTSEEQPLDIDDLSRSQLLDLEQELRHTKENLQATIEELETSNEELQATNEELIASNEELQSTNEELHSVNEELYTVNAEYQRKIVELTELTNDMDNLLVSTEVHTLFLDTSLCIRKFTPKMAEVFNLVPHDIGRRLDAFSNDIVCDQLTSKVAQVLTGHEVYEERVRDNQGHHFLMRVLPYQAGGQTNGVVLTLNEISSLVTAQEEMLRERERFERAIAANRDGTWDWPDITKDEMWWSATCWELLGYEPEELPATYSQWLSLIHPDDRRRVQQTSVPTQNECYVQLHRDFEYRMLHKLGHYRWYRHRAIVDEDEAGRTLRMTGSVDDIHDRKCAEMQYQDEIRRRDDFLAMLSHELRNPMGAVLNAIECMKVVRQQPTTPTDADAMPIRIIERQTKHMARLLDDLLDVARFGQSKIEFRKQLVDLTTLAEDVLEAVDYEVKAKDQILHATILDESLCVFADPARIKQAQVNLLTNAAKYTSEQGDIWYKLEREGDVAVITVRDTGEGIPGELLNKIFDLFTQSETTLARSSGGMGVGLSLAKGIVEAHDGTIVADSPGPGGGSTFCIRLPLTDKPVPPSVASPQASLGSRRLLLVEDNDDARSMLAKTLRFQGFEVAEAGDGKAALTLFHSFQPDVALIDIGLPEMDGYQLARAVCENQLSEQTVLIALTGYARQSDRQQALEAGFTAHLAKPLNPLELHALLASCLPAVDASSGQECD